jgi:hypothetical protein
MRRDFRQLLTCVQAVALLYQCQRRRTPEGWIESTLEDYEVARDLLAPLFDVIAAEGVTPAVRKSVAAVRPGEELSAAALARRLGIAKSSATYRIKRALDGGWLVNNEKRPTAPYRLALGAPLPEETSALPTVDRVRDLYECTNASREEEDGGRAHYSTGGPEPEALIVAEPQPDGADPPRRQGRMRWEPDGWRDVARVEGGFVYFADGAQAVASAVVMAGAQ